VLVLILHAAAPHDAGPLVRGLAEARRSLAERQRVAFLAAGVDEAEVVAGPPDGLSFGERLGAAMRARGAGAAGGAIVLGSGSIPLARAADLRRFVEVAAGPAGHALANNRYSADVVAVSRASDLAELPPLPADNALPRWLEERAGVAVADLRSRWRLGVDIDTPLDLLVLDAGRGDPTGRGDPAGQRLHGTAPLIGERLAALADILTNRRAELLVAGRISTTTLRWLESGVACRVRALVEERGLRAASRLAQSGATSDSRPPRSVLGELLDRDGPESLARTIATLADAALIDTRVLLAHRHGGDESAWPAAEDRFASDLLLPASIADPWLRAVTVSAATPSSDHPILLGGHTLVNGGLRLLAQRARSGAK
jgi:CTP:molybdopterin cytidylyltransferase MocA